MMMIIFQRPKISLARIKIVKNAAAETTPLPSFRLKELKNIIERVGEISNNYQADLSDNYDKMIKVFRAATIRETDKSLYKDMVNHLQAE